jgi:hypothetical protein
MTRVTMATAPHDTKVPFSPELFGRMVIGGSR